jgi:hypothetical protein
MTLTMNMWRSSESPPMKCFWKLAARTAALLAAAAVVLLVVSLHRTAHLLQADNVPSSRDCEFIDKHGKSVDVQPSGQSADSLALATLLGRNRTNACCAIFFGHASRRTIAGLQGLPEIHEVRLYAVRLDHEMMVELGRLRSLSKVRLLDCTVSEADLAMIREQLPQGVVDVSSTSRKNVPTPEMELYRKQINRDGSALWSQKGE